MSLVLPWPRWPLLVGSLACDLSCDVSDDLSCNLSGEGAAAAPTTPATILGSLYQFDWDARAGITVATGVSSWIEGVHGENALDATGGKQPAYDATGFHGGPCVRGDGLDDSLIATLTSTIAAGKRPYVWVVARAVSAVLEGYFAQITDDPGGDGVTDYLLLHITGVTNWAVWRGDSTGFQRVVGGAVDTSKHLFESGLTTGGTNTLVVDGVGTNSARTGATAAGMGYVGMFGRSAGLPSNFEIARYIVANNEPSAGQITAMRTYLTGPNFTGYTGSSYF